MAFAKLQSTPTKFGRGRFTVSEGIAPSEKILPDENLATLMAGEKNLGDEFFEVVLLQGTIVSTYQKSDGRYVATYCRGLAGCVVKDAYVEYDANKIPVASAKVAVGASAPAAQAGGTVLKVGASIEPDFAGTISSGVTGSLGQAAKPIGVLFKDAFRPFGNSAGTAAQGDNEGISFITRGYVDLKVGTFVKPDALGRPVKFIEGVDPEFLRVGQVIAREDLGTTGDAGKADYDFGMLNYMQLPVDVLERAILTAAYTTSGIFGVKPNLAADDTAAIQAYDGGTTLGTAANAPSCIGAVRVNLINL
jgi:hypothetical protein